MIIGVLYGAYFVRIYFRGNDSGPLSVLRGRKAMCHRGSGGDESTRATINTLFIFGDIPH